MAPGAVARRRIGDCFRLEVIGRQQPPKASFPMSSLMMSLLLMSSLLIAHLVRHSQNQQHELVPVADASALKGSREVAADGGVPQTRLGDDLLVALVAQDQFRHFLHATAELQRLGDSIPL